MLCLSRKRTPSSRIANDRQARRYLVGRRTAKKRRRKENTKWKTQANPLELVLASFRDDEFGVVKSRCIVDDVDVVVDV